MNTANSAFWLVHDYPGGASSLAPRLGKRDTYLCAEVARTGTAKLGLETAVRLSQLTGDLRILNAFAAECGCFVLRMPTTQVGDSTFKALAQAAREFSEFVGSVADAVDDGEVTANELARVDKELSELFSTSQAIRTTLAAIHEAGKPAQV